MNRPIKKVKKAIYSRVSSLIYKNNANKIKQSNTNNNKFTDIQFYIARIDH